VFLLKYFARVHEKYSLIKLLIYSIVITNILFYLDYKDLVFSRMYNNPILTIMIFSIIAIILLIVFQLTIFKGLLSKRINSIDAINLVFFSSSLFYALFITVYEQITVMNLFFIKMFIIRLSILTSFGIVLFRAYLYKIAIVKKLKNKETNNLDLKDIYHDDFSLLEDRKIFIKEEDVDYDLLGRENTIEHLFYAIKNIVPDSKFVISVEGPWGSGKTTIIKNVIKEIRNNDKDIIIIDDFDPWMYKDENLLLSNMFEILLKQLDFGFNDIKIKSLVNNLVNQVLGDKRYKIFSSIFDKKDQIIEIKEEINEIIQNTDKKIVFFIDNIDRINKENVIFLFNIVGNILDFENIVYVLSFDNERIKNIFDGDLNIEYKYLKKIIQMQIMVPMVDEKKLKDIFTTTLKNIIKKLKYEKDYEHYEHIIDFMVKNSTDLRDFKRFLNAVINIPKAGIEELYLKDLLVIKYIQINNYELYKKIKNNKSYFISETPILNIVLRNRDSSESEEINKKYRDTYEEIFSGDNKTYIDLLSEIFPYIKNYSDDIDIISTTYNEEIENDNYINNRIFLSDYFDVHFNESYNDLVELNKKVKEFLNNFPNKIGIEKKQDLYFDFLKDIQPRYYSRAFSTFHKYLKIENKNYDLYSLILIVMNNIFELFREIEPIDKELILKSIAIFTDNLDQNQFGELFFEIKNKYPKLGLFYFLLNHLYYSKNIDKKRYDNYTSFYKNLQKEIFEKDIDIYNDKDFIENKIYKLYSLFNYENHREIKDYFDKYITSENVFRFLFDLINRDDVYYCIKKDVFEKFTSITKIDTLLQKTKPQNKDEEYILSIYEKYKSMSAKRNIYDSCIEIREDFKT
jgi:hypothetical protein